MATQSGTNPSVQAHDHLLKNVPSYIMTTRNLIYYCPQLNDGDAVHAGWDGSGSWGKELTGPLAYAIDLSGGGCVDSNGPCAAPAGTGGVEMNTIMVFSRQDDGTQKEPSDTTTFTQHGPINFDVIAQPDGTTDWVVIGRVYGNNLVRRVFSFPAARYSQVQARVDLAASDGPSIVQLEAYKLVGVDLTASDGPSIVQLEAYKLVGVDLTASDGPSVVQLEG